MILTEEHRISRSRHKELFRMMDRYCYLAKNLSNSVNYLLKQCYRIHRKLAQGEILDSWEKGMIYRANCAVRRYNRARPGKRPVRYIDGNSSLTADAYFLSWYMKTWEVYRAMPYATCSQICIQERCREWRSYFRGLQEYRRDPRGFYGRPKAPGYLDPVRGRGRIVITSQNFSIDDKGHVRMPGFLSGIRVRARHRDVRQIRIQTGPGGIRIQLMYEREEAAPVDRPHAMGIDIGVNNLMAVSFSSGKGPVLINGRPLKSINQFYNKRRASLQGTAEKSNRRARPEGTGPYAQSEPEDHRSCSAGRCGYDRDRQECRVETEVIHGKEKKPELRFHTVPYPDRNDTVQSRAGRHYSEADGGKLYQRDKLP